MADCPEELRYASSHEWARLLDDGSVLVGITDHAQEALGDVVYVELPEVGAAFEAGDEAGVVESVKAASDVYAPVSGRVVEVNASLEDAPDKVNTSPYGDGWFYRLTPREPAELDRLLSAAAYREQCALEDH
jgi:glycine cleavage system H protein